MRTRRRETRGLGDRMAAAGPWEGETTEELCAERRGVQSGPGVAAHP